MKTLLISTDEFRTLPGIQWQGAAAGNTDSIARGSAVRLVTEWMPTPDLRPRLPAIQPRRHRLAKPSHNIWLAYERETFVERLMPLALALGAVVAIGYGFSCCLDLAQHWAGFNAGVEQLIR